MTAVGTKASSKSVSNLRADGQISREAEIDAAFAARQDFELGGMLSGLEQSLARKVDVDVFNRHVETSTTAIDSVRAATKTL